MKVVLGLGNPGPRYDATRHNVGWWVIDRIVHDWNAGPFRREGPALVADGGFAGMLCVRAFGFDLDGVPDGEDDVRTSMRSSFGNLKRRADARYAEHVARGGKPRVTKGAIPDFVVRGAE